MKTRLIKTLASLVLLFTAQTAVAFYDWCFQPHVGIDYKYWGVEAKKGPTTYEYLFPDLTRAGTIYIGTRINKLWGIDFGYDRSSTKDKWHAFEQPSAAFGAPSNVGDTTEIDMRLEAWHLSGLFYWEMIPNLELVLHAGIVSLQPKSRILYYPLGGAPVEMRFKTESKWAGRFGFGAQYLFPCILGVRALLTWDQTSRINYLGLNHQLSTLDIKPYNNALSFNVGVFAEFG